ncbi:MAG: hypothetical protein ACOY40_09665 [Bacillota bacterium]
MENSPLFDGIREEWIEKGRIKTSVDFILEALEEKTGGKPCELAERLSAINDSESLRKLHRIAVKSAMLDQLMISLEC